MQALGPAISNRGYTYGQALQLNKRIPDEVVGFLSAWDIGAFDKGRLEIARPKLHPELTQSCFSQRLRLVAMDLEFDLFGEDTTVDDFMEVITCKDLSKNTIIIYWAANYNIIEGFRKRLKPWCPNLIPADMERSGIFMNLNNRPFKAASLYKSPQLLREESDRMDAIFKAKYR